MTSCFCGRSLSFSNCCQPLILGHQKAITAEQLMRSRYSAFVVGNLDYLLSTQIPLVSQDEFDLSAHIKWTKLIVKNSIQGEDKDQHGHVLFEAHFNDLTSGKLGIHSELSEFKKVNGDWKYVLPNH